MKNQNKASSLTEEKKYSTEEILLITGGITVLIGVAVYFFVKSSMGSTILTVARIFSNLEIL